MWLYCGCNDFVEEVDSILMYFHLKLQIFPTFGRAFILSLSVAVFFSVAIHKVVKGN